MGFSPARPRGRAAKPTVGRRAAPRWKATDRGGRLVSDPATRQDTGSVRPDTPARPAAGARALIQLLRPRQWTKNALLFAALVFSENLFDARMLAIALAAFASFCLISSSVYVVNDLADAERDRIHPTKRFRPIAAGAVSVGTSLALAGLLTALGLAASFWIRPEFGLIVVAYLGLSHFYSFAGKNVVILDTLLIASGFVLRAAAGAVAIDVPASGWFIICTLFAALFIALCKRKAELLSLEGGGSRHRPVLAQYSSTSLTVLIAVSMAAVLMSYSLYVIDARGAAAMKLDALSLTLPFVLYGVFRYYWLVEQSGEGGSPEETLLRDRGIRIAVLGFVGLAVAAYYLP